jgi:hypothetical protein
MLTISSQARQSQKSPSLVVIPRAVLSAQRPKVLFLFTVHFSLLFYVIFDANCGIAGWTKAVPGWRRFKIYFCAPLNKDATDFRIQNLEQFWSIFGPPETVDLTMNIFRVLSSRNHRIRVAYLKNSRHWGKTFLCALQPPELEYFRSNANSIFAPRCVGLSWAGCLANGHGPGESPALHRQSGEFVSG